MKKVLIVDDEMIVRLGLKSMIDWQKNGFAIVGEAKSGSEALKIIKDSDVDLVITDISMPEMDGFELVKLSKKINPNLKFIILTHYDDFDFARKAIDLKVENYILKSELDANSLIETLNKLTSENKVEIRNVEKTGELNALLKKLLLSDTIDIGDEYLKNIDICSLAYGIILDELYEYSEEILKRNQIIQDIFRETFKTVNWNFNIFINKNEVLILSFTTKDNHSEEKIKDLFSVFLDNLKSIMDLNMLLKTSFSTKIQKIESCLKTLKEEILYDYFGEKQSFSESLFTYRIDFEYLSEIVNTGNLEDSLKYLETIFNYLKEKRNIDYCFKIFYKIFKIFIDASHNSIEESFQEDSVRNLNILELKKANTFESQENFIFHVCRRFFSEKSKKESYSLITIKALKIIEKNFSDNISLSKIAECLDINKSYLSTTFKNDTGKNLSNYILEFRIERAKDLLVNSEMKIYEIAEEVGFSNVYYFSKVFKDIVGITCKEYRKMHVYKNIN